MLKPDGVATFEFPHLLRMVQENQFDTVYHEHYSYLSLTTVERVFAQRTDTGRHPVSEQVAGLLQLEAAEGMNTAAFYQGFQRCAEQVKDELLAFLLEARQQGLKVVAYGAAAKGNTLLNFAGVRFDLLSYVVDKNPGGFWVE